MPRRKKSQKRPQQTTGFEKTVPNYPLFKTGKRFFELAETAPQNRKIEVLQSAFPFIHDFRQILKNRREKILTKISVAEYNQLLGEVEHMLQSIKTQIKQLREKSR